jgi:hypothetical protein
MSFWKTIKSFFNKESVISVTETPIVNTVVPKKATPAIVAETFDNMMAEAKTQATAQKKKRYYKKSNKQTAKKPIDKKPIKKDTK